MKFVEIRRIAHDMGIKTAKLKKREIIRQIQINEKNAPCFDSGLNDCIQYNCIWRDDCLG